MNLLFVTYNLLLSEGEPLPVEILVEKINRSKSFKKSDKSPVSIDELSNLILKYGKQRSLKIDSNGLVSIVFIAGRYISNDYNKIMDLLRGLSEENKLIPLTIIFYTQISKPSDAYYNLKGLNLMPIEELVKQEDPKKTFINELKRLDQHEYFNGKLIKAISLIEILENNIVSSILKINKPFDGEEDDFADQFEKLVSDNDRREINFTPLFIREIIAKLTVSRAFKYIYNPNVGAAELFSSILNLLPNSQDVQFVGESAFNSFSVVGTMNMALREVQNFSIFSGDPLFKSVIQPNRYDCIVCQPPFGGSSSIKDWQQAVPYLKFGQSSRLENVLLQYIIYVLNNTGRAFIILSEAFMFSENKSDKAVRKYLIDNDYIDSIISLPIGTYENARIKTNILIIDKNKPKIRLGKVLFFDISSIWASALDKAQIKNVAHNVATIVLEGKNLEMICESISIEKIIDNNYRFQVSHYVNSFTENLRKIIENEEKVVKIKDVLADVKFQNIASESGLAYIKGGDLSKDATDPYLYIKDENHSSLNVNGKIIDDSSILVARIGGNLNPTIFLFDGEPIVVNQNVYALPINSNKINLKYFALELNSELVKEQLKVILTGTSMRYYNYNDLLEIKIRLPELAEQKKRVLIYEEQIIASKKKETKFLAEKISSQEDEIKILSAMKHGFAQLPFKTDLSNIETYFNNKINSKGTISWMDPVSPAPKSRTIRGVFDGLHSLIDNANDLFKNMENLINCDPSKMKLERVNIQNFIGEIIKEMPNLDGINVSFDCKNMFVQIDKFQFKEMIRNFVFNACKHGFKSDSPFKVLFFRTEYETDSWILKIRNTGSAFPSDFSFDDFVTFGKKSNSNNGSGIGGYLINKVVKNHLGDFKISEIPTNELYTSDYYNAIGIPIPKEHIEGVEFELKFPLILN